MEDKQLSGEESMNIIQKMIQVARDDHRENGDGWLIWGWLLFLSSVLSAIFAHLNLLSYISWTWSVMLITGLSIYIIFHVRKQNRQRVKTYVQELLDKIGTGFFISLFAIIAGSSIQQKGNFGFGYYFILYAFWMYIHGTAIRFRPLLVGAFVNWAAAIAIFFIKDTRLDMIISAVAILVGYLIPGYLLRYEYKKNYIREESRKHGV
jgi:Flp pilus assembly protein TadB